MGRLGALHRAILSGDEQAFGRELGFIARNSASYYDLTNEAACHMMVFGLLFGMPGYGDPLSNREALGQISAQGYDAAAPGLRWGVAFAGKRVAVACERAR